MLDKSKVWAKLNPFESLDSHMIKAGRVCKVLITRSSLRYAFDSLKSFVHTNMKDEEFINFISYVVALHDIGKATPFFQSKDDDTKIMLDALGLNQYYIYPRVRHEYYSRKYFENYLGSLHMNVEPGVVSDIALMLGYHHYKEYNKYVEIEDSSWIDFIKVIEQSIYDEFKFNTVEIFDVTNKSAFYNIFLGLLIISDWIASGNEISSLNMDDFKEDVDVYSYIASYGFRDFAFDFKSIDYKLLLNEKILKFRPLQNWTLCYNRYNKTKFMLIEAGTGEGKTSVAFYSAFQMMNETEGFYYALPMEVMVNSKYEELCRILKDKGVNINLLHRNRCLVDGANEVYKYYDNFIDDDIEVSDFLTSSSKQGLLSKYIVGTIDQLLYGVLHCKFNALRLLGLLNKTIILDEIHAYDTYTGELICKLLELCRVYGIKVIMLSATLSSSLKNKYISAYLGESVTVKSFGYPLITTVTDDNSITEHTVNGSELHKQIDLIKTDILSDIESQGRMISELYHNDGGCIIVYKNTVKEAQQLYGLLKDNVDNLILCHSRFKLKDRKNKEDVILKLFGKDCSNRPDRYVVIATQVLEACLDLNFDVCFSDIAPIDILAQRLGRVHRFELANNYKKNGTIYLFTSANSDYGLSSEIYADILLLQTDKYLSMKSELKLPDMLREALEFIYTSDILDSSINVFNALYRQRFKDSQARMLASSSLIDFNSSKFKLELNAGNVSTRMNESETLILLDDKDRQKYNLMHLDDSTYKEMMFNSFNCSYRYLPESAKYIESGRLKGKYVVYMDGIDYSHVSSNKKYLYNIEEGYKVESI